MAKKIIDYPASDKPKKTKLPTLEIRQRAGANGIMVGANTELLIDGEIVRGATGVRFEVNAKGVATATITLIGRFKVTGKVKAKKVKLYK